MSVGQTLAEARAQRGLSVEDVSAATRIRGGLIRDIESDRFDSCGGDVYARGHIRSIARLVGVDATPLIAEFDTAHDVEPTLVTAATAPVETDRAALAHSERRNPNWAAAMVVALLVVIAVAAYSAFGTGSNKPQRTTAGSSQPAPGTKASPNPGNSKAAHNPPPSSVAYGGNPHKAILQIRATTGTSWLQVSDAADGATLFEGNLMPGQHKRFVKPFALMFVIGNAPAVDLVVNGKDFGAPKSSGNVARGKIQPGSRQIQAA